MKSKKKLIYKLHENINQNPFKKIDQLSFRNAGIRSYDFNKLKSIRAISLKGLDFNQIDSGKYSDSKKNHNKINKLSVKEEFQNKTQQQALISNKKKIVIDNSLLNMQRKKLNLRTSFKQKSPQEKILSNQNPKTIDYAGPQECQEDQYPNSHYKKTQITYEQNQDHTDRTSPRPKNNPSHSRNISLPIINSHKQQIQHKSISFVSPTKQLDKLVDQQRAKEQILKQIRLKAQQKINKQVLMSIKLKSIQNLQRIARSQSQVIKIDKWKQKYGHPKIGEQMKFNEAYLNIKDLLPQKEPKINGKDDLQSPQNNIKPSIRYMGINQDEQGELQKSQIEIAKNLLNNVTASQDLQRQSQPIFSYSSTVLQRQFPSVELNNLQNKMNFIEQQYNSTIVNRDQMSHYESWHSQPLKLTITRLKKLDYKSKQGVNLPHLPQKNPQPNKKASSKIEFHSLNLHENSLNQQNKSITQDLQKIQTDLINNQSVQSLQNLTSPTAKQQLHINTELQLGRNKSPNKQEDSYLLSSPITLKSKKINTNKCKINIENKILDKIVEDGRPEEWQQRRLIDDQLTDFDNFVQKEAKQAQAD